MEGALATVTYSSLFRTKACGGLRANSELQWRSSEPVVLLLLGLEEIRLEPIRVSNRMTRQPRHQKSCSLRLYKAPTERKAVA